MTPPIATFAIDEFRNGKRLLYVTEPGAVDTITKDGAVTVPYAAGDIALADCRGNLICGPVGKDGAIELAERILNGEERYVTDPLALLVLASAICGFRFDDDHSDTLRTVGTGVA